MLISGASVAGPTAAYWLSRHGFDVTVVERMPLERVVTSGHAVDLFGPARDVATWMGVLPTLVENRTRTDVVSFVQDHGGGVDLEMSELVAGAAGGHVEIMRGRLAAILYEATRNDVHYLFGDSIQTIDQQPDGVAVTFEHAPPTGSTCSSEPTVCTPRSVGWLPVPWAVTWPASCFPTTSTLTGGWWSGTLPRRSISRISLTWMPDCGTSMDMAGRSGAASVRRDRAQQVFVCAKAGLQFPVSLAEFLGQDIGAVHGDAGAAADRPPGESPALPMRATRPEVQWPITIWLMESK